MRLVEGREAMWTEQKLIEISKSQASLREAGEVMGCSRQKVWLWQKGVARFTDLELAKLEAFLTARLSEHLATLEQVTRV
jgi:hypothetical protein